MPTGLQCYAGMTIVANTLFASQLNPKHLTPEARSAIGKVDINEYAQEIHINFPPPRLDQYLTSDYDNIQESVVRFADAILYRIGFSQVFVELPVLRQLRNTRTFSLFLGLILNIVIFILLFLSVVLIYSLLMISVETRTFELGILRMIGTTRRGTSYMSTLVYPRKWSHIVAKNVFY
jgi:hypothetical protein